jgi:hypothetical protein
LDGQSRGDFASGKSLQPSIAPPRKQADSLQTKKERIMFKAGISLRAKLLLTLTALVMPAISTSAQINNCCHIDRQCTTEAEWVSGYYAMQNNECAAAAAAADSAAASSESSQFDNCCFTGWQCDTNDDWVSGYYAFQNNQCGALSPQQEQVQAATSSSQPQTAKSETSDNCCFIGWHCESNEDWLSGYFAFQANQCDSSQAGWQAQWRKREEASASRRQQLQQEQEPEDPWWGLNPWDWVCNGRPCAVNPNPVQVVSITVDLKNPNRRIEETDDGTPVVLHPDLPD